MSRRKPCGGTLDLFSWTPPAREICQVFGEAVTRLPTPYARLIRAMATSIEESGMSRAEVAGAMSAWLGQSISEASLAAALSEARTDHVPNVLRFQALAVVTRDARLANLLVNPAGLIAVPRKYADVIKLAQVREEKARLAAQEKRLRRETDSLFGRGA